jgi:TolB-like protein
VTCSTSSSSRRRPLAALLVGCLAWAVVAPVRAGEAESGDVSAAEPARPSRIAIMPIENLSDMQAPVRELGGWLEVALASAGIEVVSGELVDRFFVQHRVRYVGGLDRATAAAAAEDLGVDGVLVSTLTLYDVDEPPRLGLMLRLLSTVGQPQVYWIDGASAAGDDSPGLLDLGVIHQVEPLARRVFAPLARSLAGFLAGNEARSKGCPGEWRYEPRTAFRAAVSTQGGPAKVAVLPFQNTTRRSRAGEIVALELVRQLSTVKRFTVLEPGLVREELLKNRIITQGGVSLENARMALGAMEADYVVAGTVRKYEDGRGGMANPSLDFTVIMIDTHTNETVWHSTSTGAGLDGVWFFGLRRVSTGSELACRLVRGVVDQMARAPVGPRARPYSKPPE